MKRLLSLGLVALSVTAVPHVAQTSPEWRPSRPVSDGDKARVIELAARLSIQQPAAITSEEIFHPLACEALRVESIPTVTGQRRRWKRAWIANTEWPRGCRAETSDSPSVANWVVAFRVPDVGAWRIEDRDGVQDVETASTTPYADVAAIVQRVKANQLLNRLPPAYRGKPIPKVDGKAIYLIWNDQHEPSLYTVRFRSTNVVLLVAVRGTWVELHGWVTEVS